MWSNVIFKIGIQDSVFIGHFGAPGRYLCLLLQWNVQWHLHWAALEASSPSEALKTRPPGPHHKLFHFNRVLYYQNQRWSSGWSKERSSWILEEEFPSQSFSGELMCIEQVNIREFTIFLWLVQRLTTFSLFFFLKNITLKVLIRRSNLVSRYHS